MLKAGGTPAARDLDASTMLKDWILRLKQLMGRIGEMGELSPGSVKGCQRLSAAGAEQHRLELQGHDGERPREVAQRTGRLGGRRPDHRHRAAAGREAATPQREPPRAVPITAEPRVRAKKPRWSLAGDRLEVADVEQGRERHRRRGGEQHPHAQDLEIERHRRPGEHEPEGHQERRRGERQEGGERGPPRRQPEGQRTDR